MTIAYGSKLGVVTQKIDISAKKTNNLAFITYKMVKTGFLLQEKLGKI